MMIFRVPNDDLSSALMMIFRVPNDDLSSAVVDISIAIKPLIEYGF
jgi:hypothetical protein